MCLPDRLVGEALWRLRSEKPVALDRCVHASVARSTLQRVRNGKRWQRPHTLRSSRDHLLDQFAVDEWTHGIMDQHEIGRSIAKRLERQPHRFLPCRAAMHGTDIADDA